MTTSIFRIEVAKNGSFIPVVNDFHLHSLYDPQKEAYELVSAHENDFKEHSHILVLGLGFGYHIPYIEELLKKYHGDKGKIVVIEPLAQVKEEAINRRLVNDNIALFSADNPLDLYRHHELIQFLKTVPFLFFHPASYNIHHDYFKQYLSYRATNILSGIVPLIENEQLQNYLKTLSLDHGVAEAVALVKQKPVKSEFDFFLMAYDELR